MRMFGPVGQDFAQPPEEVGAVAVEFLHPLRQRHVEPLAEVGDLGLALAVAVLGSVERILQRADLPAQRRDLLVEQFDLRQRPLAESCFSASSSLDSAPIRLLLLGSCARSGLQAASAGANVRSLLRRARPAEWRGCLPCPACRCARAPAAGQLVDLRIEAVEHFILAGDLAAEQELRQHEHRQQEHDRQQQRRKRVDETRPVIDPVARASGAAQRHGIGSSALGRAVEEGVEAFQQVEHLLLLLGLPRHLLAHHLLLAAHVLHEALDAFRQMSPSRQSPRCPPAASALLEALRQVFEPQRGCLRRSWKRRQRRTIWCSKFMSVTEDSQFSSSV